jgi:diketogulonate reductase-like aldo/keto reductase
MRTKTAMRTVRLPSGKSVPALGLGTWEMGEDATKWEEEVEALRTGIDLGMTLIDTAEMYGDGSAEELIAEAVGNRRKEVYLVSKVLPQNASMRGTIAACEASLRRLNTDHLDLYLLHWRGSIPLEETFEAFQLLKQSGKILDYGVSNFDLSDMEEALRIPGGDKIVTNQVLYNLMRRGIEWDLLPWSQENKIPIMAYSPVERGRLFHNSALKLIAERHGVTPAQVALAWVLRQKGVIAIPKASKPSHVIDNRAALEMKLTVEDFRELDEAFPPPSRKVPLEML